MSSYEKNRIIAIVSSIIGAFLAGVGGILGILDGRTWQYVLCVVGLLCVCFSIFADN